MPVLIILGILAVWGIAKLYESFTKSNHVFTKEELDSIMRQSAGKSQKECRDILKKYK